MPSERLFKAWLLAERAAVHGEIALALASRRSEGHPMLKEVQRMARALRQQADLQLGEIIQIIAHTPRR